MKAPPAIALLATVGSLATGFPVAAMVPEHTVAIIIGDEGARNQAKLGRLEAALTRLALDYRFIAERAEARPNEMVVDARQDFDLSALQALETLSENVRRRLAFRLLPDWSAAHCIARDRTSALASISNTAAQTQNSVYLGARHQRRPEPRAFAVEFLSLAPDLPYTLYDLDEKRSVLRGQTATSIALPSTSHDFLPIIGGSQPRSCSSATAP